MMKLINVRRHFAAFALAASLTIGCMAVAYAQGTGDTAPGGEECPFADTEHGSCRDGATTADKLENNDEAAPDDSPELVPICHRPGTPAQQTLFVALIATPAHMGHGDTPGACTN